MKNRKTTNSGKVQSNLAAVCHLNNLTRKQTRQFVLPQPLPDDFDADINSKLNEPLLAFLLQPMEPVTFCIRWLPVKRRYKWGDYGARQAANEMLAEITGLEPGSWNNYLTSEDGPPIIYKRYLRAIDILWQILRLFRIPLKRLVA